MSRAHTLGVWAQRVVIAAVVVAVVGFALRVGSSSSQALDFRDPTVWLADNVHGEVVQANAGTGEVATRVAIGPARDALLVSQQGTGAIVLDTTTGKVSHLDGVSQKLSQQALVAGAAGGAAKLLGHNGSARVVTADAVHVIDPETGAPGASVPVSGLNDAVLDSAGTVWGLGTAGRLVAVTTHTATDVHLADQVRPLAIAAAGPASYLVDADGPSVLSLDTGPPRAHDPHCVDGPFTGAARAGGSIPGDGAVVVVVDGNTGTVRMSDVEHRTCSSAVLPGRGGHTFGLPVASGGFAYVPDTATGEIVKLRVSDGSLVGAYTTGAGANHSVDLLVKDGTVWFNDPDGNAAGCFGRDGTFTPIDKSGGRPSGAPPGAGAPGAPSAQPGAATTPSGSDPSTNGAGGGGGSGTSGPTNTDASKGAGDPSGSTVTRGAANTGGDPNPAQTPNKSGLVADFTFSSRVVEIGESVTFTDASSGAPTAWTWEFGDGSFASGPKTAHSWSQSGIYTVTLRIENATASASASTAIQVLGPEDKVKPVADFRFSASRVEVGKSVSFTDRSSGHPSQLKWNFGDGTTATGGSVSHAWSSAGAFSVTLTATNAQGSNTTNPTVITVFDAVQKPTATITSGANTANVGQSVTFASSSTGNPTELKWNFGDGTTALGESVSHAWTRAGTYTLTLDVSNSAGSASASTTVTITDLTLAPVARFTTSAEVTEENQSIRFTSLSINNPTVLRWDFGDGTSASGGSVTHSFAHAGSYTVTLRASNSAGQDSTQKQITVLSQLPPPVAAFTMSPDHDISTLTAVQFTDGSTGGTPSSWAWDFGDGTTSSQTNPTHIFGSAGSWMVRLTVTNSRGSNSVARSVTVNPAPPTADFTWSPRTPAVGAVVQFTDTSPGGGITAWAWDFGDGITSTQQNPTHAFAAAQTYVVRLTVTNVTGTSPAKPVEIAVAPPAPAAGFSYLPATGINTKTVVQFTNTSTGGAGTAAWDFGDGSIGSTAVSPTHTFLSPGDFPVRLTMTNGTGTSATIQTVHVTVPPPGASFTVSLLHVVNTPITFTDTSTGGATSWLWNFGDGTTSTVQNPAHTYTAAFNPVTVTLTVTNAGGTSSPFTQSFQVFPQPVASLTASTTAPNAGASVTFTNKSTGGPFTTAVWHWGDGTPDFTQTNVSADSTAGHVFTIGGSFPVTLTVTNTGGGTATSLATNVVVKPVAKFTAAPGGAARSVQFTNTSIGATTYEWDFGDGSPKVTTANPEHTYAAGVTTVTVTLTAAAGGQSAVSTLPLDMTAPTASFTASPPPFVSHDITFTNTSTPGPFLSVVWHWGDGTESSDTATTVHHVFPPGLSPGGGYSVTVTVTKLGGTATSAAQVFPFLV